jgi:hypothetical protein
MSRVRVGQDDDVLASHVEVHDGPVRFGPGVVLKPCVRLWGLMDVSKKGQGGRAGREREGGFNFPSSCEEIEG